MRAPPLAPPKFVSVAKLKPLAAGTKLATPPVAGPPERSTPAHPTAVHEVFGVQRTQRPEDTAEAGPCEVVSASSRPNVARRAKVIEDHPHNAAMRYAGTLSACGLSRGAKRAGPRLDVSRPRRTIVVMAPRIWVPVTESSRSIRVAAQCPPLCTLRRGDRLMAGVVRISRSGL